MFNQLGVSSSISGSHLCRGEAVLVENADDTAHCVHGVAVIVTTDGIFWNQEEENAPNHHMLNMQDCVGYKKSSSRFGFDVEVIAFLATPHQHPVLKASIPKRQKITIKFRYSEELQERNMCRALNVALDFVGEEEALTASQHHDHPKYRKRHLQAIVNSRGRGRDILKNIVLPILHLVKGLEVHVIETQRAGHAGRIARDLDLNTIEGIISVGGDGTLFEIINGLYSRTDGIKCAIGVVPAGTGNALATWLCDNDPQTAAYAIAKGITATLDLNEVKINEHLEGDQRQTLYSFLHTSYGAVPDIEFESEPLRFMGLWRYTVSAIRRVLLPRSYPIKISYCPLDKEPSDETQWIHKDREDVFWLSVCNAPFLSSDLLTSPDLRLNDGHLQVCTIPNTAGRVEMGWLLWKMENGHHVNHRAWAAADALMAKFEVLSDRIGHLDIDGEEVFIPANSKIGIRVLPGGLSAFAEPTIDQP